LTIWAGVSSNGSASRRLGAAIERDVLSLPPYRRLHVSLHTYLRSPSNFEAIRLIAEGRLAVDGWRVRIKRGAG